jgi:Uma2 family endonuclease
MALPLENDSEESEMATRAVDVYRWTREEYYQLAEKGFFPPGKRVELIDGVIYEMSPQKSPHATGISLVLEALRAAFPQGHHVRVQLPLALSDDSEPEPDLAVVSGRPRDYLEDHPKTAALIVEVSHSSSFHDRERKRSRYARSGIPEYWIVDVTGKQLEVYRNPGEGGYQTRLILKTGETVAPLANPKAAIPVADLLP